MCRSFVVGDLETFFHVIEAMLGCQMLVWLAAISRKIRVRQIWQLLGGRCAEGAAWSSVGYHTLYGFSFQFSKHRSCSVECQSGFVVPCFQLEKARWFKSDDTALNGVSLKCVRPGSYDFEGNIASMEGTWGDWRGTKRKDKLHEHKTAEWEEVPFQLNQTFSRLRFTLVLPLQKLLTA